MSTSDVEPQISSLFFYEIVYIKVEDTIFCVPRNQFASTSEVFADMFLLPSRGGADVEGQSKSNPIVLPAQYKKDDFTSLLKVMYPSAQLLLSQASTQLTLGLTKEEMIGVLRLSTIWQMDKIHDYAVHILSTNHSLEPVEKILLARAHKVAKWFEEGVTSLVDMVEEAPFTGLGTLGWFTAAQILHLRDIRSTRTNQYGFSLGNVRCGCNRVNLFPGNSASHICSGCSYTISSSDVVHAPNLTSTGTMVIPFNSAKCPKCSTNPFSNYSGGCGYCTMTGSGNNNIRVQSVHLPLDVKAKVDEKFGDEIEECRYQASQPEIPLGPMVVRNGVATNLRARD